MQLRLSPLAARSVLGRPAAEVVGLDVSAVDVLGGWAERLREHISSVDTWEQRFAIVDAELGGRMSDALPAPPLRAAWRLLLRSGGTARIAEVADQVGWGERHLAARFRQEIGLTLNRHGFSAGLIRAASRG